MSSGPTPTAPPPPPPPPQPPAATKTDRTTLFALIGGGILALGIIGVLVALLLKPSGTEQVLPEPTEPGATGSTAQPTTSPTAEPQPEPSGETVQLPASVSVLVPDGWRSNFTEGSDSVFLSDDLGNSVMVIAAMADEKGDAMATLLGFQNAFISPEADYSEIQVTGPEYQDAVSPVTSYAQLSFTANWTDTQGRVWPREGRMDALVRQDGGILFIMVEAKGGSLTENQARWGPILDSSLESFTSSP